MAGAAASGASRGGAAGRRVRLARFLLALWLAAGASELVAACCKPFPPLTHGHGVGEPAHLHTEAAGGNDCLEPAHSHCPPPELSDRSDLPAAVPALLPAPATPAPPAAVVSVAWSPLTRAAAPYPTRAPPTRSVLDLTRRLRI